MFKEIVLTETAGKDLASLPDEVVETFFSKRQSAKKSMNIGAEPDKAIGKYLAGNMHPVIQMNLGRDFRAWFVEGEYIEELDDDNIYCVKICTKKEAKKLTGQIRNALEYVQRNL